jgi:hypothetical protein
LSPSSPPCATAQPVTENIEIDANARNMRSEFMTTRIADLGPTEKPLKIDDFVRMNGHVLVSASM